MSRYVWQEEEGRPRKEVVLGHKTHNYPPAFTAYPYYGQCIVSQIYGNRILVLETGNDFEDSNPKLKTKGDEMKKQFLKPIMCANSLKFGLAAIALSMTTIHLYGQSIGKIVQDLDEFTWQDILPSAELQVLMTLKNANPAWPWEPDSSYMIDLGQIGRGTVSWTALFNEDIFLGYQLYESEGLRWLNLHGGEFSGPIPSNIGNLTGLTSLVLSSNNFSGTIPSSMGNLTNLQTLSLWGNNLTGTIPASLGDLGQLNHLWLSGNSLSGTIPDSLGNLVNLRSLHLQDNQLTGGIPESIGSLINLQTLYFYWNDLTGSIPASFGNLTSLQELYLNGNRLSGVIPSSLLSLPNLKELVLGGNELRLGQITSNSTLETLDISWNGMEGPIPAGLGSLTGIRNLTLAGNRFYGPLPGFLSNLTSLVSLDISYNDFKAQENKPAWISTIATLQGRGVSVWDEPQFWRRIGQIIQMGGDVQVAYEWDGVYEDLEVEIGSWVFENDRITTGTASFCVIRLLDNSAFNLNENSSAKVELFSDVEPSLFGLIRGTLRRFLTEDYVDTPDYGKTKLYIKSRTSVTGVRGTDIEVTYLESGEDAQIELTLYSGIVDFLDLITGETLTLENTGHISRNQSLLPAVAEALDFLASLQPNPTAASLLSVGQSDRLSNLAKIAFNLDLHSPNRSYFAPSGGEPRGIPLTERLNASEDSSILTMTYPRRTDLTLVYAPLFSTNLLEGWFPFPEPVSVIPIDENWEEVTVEVEIPSETTATFTVMNIGLPTSGNE